MSLTYGFLRPAERKMAKTESPRLLANLCINAEWQRGRV
jgi:hypothetical protein